MTASGELKSKLFWIIVLVLAFACWWFFGKSDDNDGQFRAFSMPMPETDWAAVANGKVDVDGGIIEVAARSGGTYREVFVEEGDIVEAGQVLAVQEDDEEKISLRSSEASLEAARAQLDRLEGERKIRTILGIEVPQILIPVAPGRNIEVLVEAAVRNHILAESGNNATQKFIELQQIAINNQS